MYFGEVHVSIRGSFPHAGGGSVEGEGGGKLLGGGGEGGMVGGSGHFGGWDHVTIHLSERGKTGKH